MRFRHALSWLLCLMLWTAGAAAQDKYPSRPVKVLVPYAPGGATDIVARVVGEQLRQILGQSFVVENKPGAFGILAIEEMARSKPDGYTLMLGNVSTNAITPVLFPKKLSIDYAKDVVPVARLADLPAFLVATKNNFPPKSFAEFVAYVKQHPGKVRYCSVGVGSYPHFDMEVLSRRAGLDMIHIPVKAGAGGIINDLVNGDLQVCFLNVATTSGQVRAGHLQVYAVVSDKRLPDFPDFPTMAEVGYPGVGTIAWQALFAPSGTPPDVIETLHKAVVQALESEPVRDSFKKSGIRAAPTASPEDARTWLRGEMEAWRKIVAETKIDLTE